MTRDEVLKILEQHSNENGGATQFTVEIEPKDMRAFIGRLRHFEAKGTIGSYNEIDERHIEIIDYVAP